MDALQKRWEAAWARKLELEDEQARFLETMATMEPAMADRALRVLGQQQEELARELLAIEAALKELEGDDSGAPA